MFSVSHFCYKWQVFVIFVTNGIFVILARVPLKKHTHINDWYYYRGDIMVRSQVSLLFESGLVLKSPSGSTEKIHKWGEIFML